MVCYMITMFFFFNDTATTEIYTLSLHDALPIYFQPCDRFQVRGGCCHVLEGAQAVRDEDAGVSSGSLRLADPPSRRGQDRKSTRLNSSHANISYAVFCLKKKNNVVLYSIFL